MKSRASIPAKYKWDLSHIYNTKDDLYSDIEKVKKLLKKSDAYKGKLTSKKTLLDFFKYQDEIGMILEKLGGYAYLLRSEDMSKSDSIKIFNDVESMEEEISKTFAWVDSQLATLEDSFLDKLIKDKDFADYRLDLEEIKRHRPHTLNESEELIMSKVSGFAGNFSKIFDNIDVVDIRFDDIVVDGKHYPLNNANFISYLQNKNREIRKQAYYNLYKGYHSLGDTIASVLLGSVKADETYSDIFHYENTLSQALYGDNLPKEIFFNLIENVNKNLKYLHEYYRLKKKALKYDKLYTYDMNANIGKWSQKLDFEKMKEIVIEALAPLGEEYISNIRHALENNWIDVYPTKNKETGGYNLGVYGVHSYILLNNVGTIDCLFTLAHELGHAMHHLYSMQNQPYNTAGNDIFTAEIASTVNEVLLMKHLYKTCTKNQEKLFVLDRFVNTIVGTLYNQTMYSEWEYWLHDKVAKKESVTKDMMNDMYYDLYKKYVGKSVSCVKENGYKWYRISHFYRAYYVFKYATGITSACSLASDVLAGNIEKYMEFLKSGDSDYPNNILSRTGVDLLTDAPYDKIFAEMDWALKEMKKII